MHTWSSRSNREQTSLRVEEAVAVSDNDWMSMSLGRKWFQRDIILHRGTLFLEIKYSKTAGSPCTNGSKAGLRLVGGLLFSQCLFYCLTCLFQLPDLCLGRCDDLFCERGQ